MTEEVNGGIDSMSDISCWVVETVNIKDMNEVGECFQQETCLFSNAFVNEGGVGSTV